MSPRRGAPRSAALSSAGEECASTSDAPCRDELRGFRPRRPPPGPPFPRAPSRTLTPCDPKRLPSTSARSTRPPPLRRNERISNASPPPVLGLRRPSIRLPTLFRRLGSRRRRWLDRGRYRALFTPGRSWPRAARRLLQPKTICKHDRRTSKPGSHSDGPRERIRFSTRVARLSPSCLVLRVGPHSDCAAAAFTTTIQSKGSRGFTGQGPFDCIAIDDCAAGLPPR